MGREGMKNNVSHPPVPMGDWSQDFLQTPELEDAQIPSKVDVIQLTICTRQIESTDVEIHGYKRVYCIALYL